MQDTSAYNVGSTRVVGCILMLVAEFVALRRDSTARGWPRCADVMVACTLLTIFVTSNIEEPKDGELVGNDY